MYSEVTKWILHWPLKQLVAEQRRLPTNARLPPMAFYGILALAVAVTARVAEKDVPETGLIQGMSWLLPLLHVPVVMAWLHLWIFLL